MSSMKKNMDEPKGVPTWCWGIAWGIAITTLMASWECRIKRLERVALTGPER